MDKLGWWLELLNDTMSTTNVAITSLIKNLATMMTGFAAMTRCSEASMPATLPLPVSPPPAQINDAASRDQSTQPS
jgi:hypothetical protein